MCQHHSETGHTSVAPLGVGSLFCFAILSNAPTREAWISWVKRSRDNECSVFVLSLLITDTLLQRMYDSVSRSLAEGKGRCISPRGQARRDDI
jgi:hypothetical protein